MKRFLAIILIVILLIPTTAIAANNGPSDWAKAEIQAAIKLGIVPLRLQKDYQKSITREEFAELLVNSALLTAEAKSDTLLGLKPDFNGRLTKELLVAKVKSPEFADTKATHVKAAYILGFINGISDTKFDPDSKITREQAATMMANYSQGVEQTIKYTDTTKLYRDRNKIAAWALDAVEVCYGGNIMKGTGENFNPKGSYTREQAIACINRAHKSFNSFINLRGKVHASISTLDRGWEVGRDYVGMSYAKVNRELQAGELKLWETVCKINNLEYTEPTPTLLNAYDASKAARQFPINTLKASKQLLINDDVLVSSWLTDKYIVKYSIVQNSGYISKENGMWFVGRERLPAIVRIPYEEKNTTY
jgi:hypothetical protein